MSDRRFLFDILPADIGVLKPEDVRPLVTLLARSELESKGHSRAAVTAGGHENEPDGGIDISVDLDQPLSGSQYVPRAKTGFQVKATEMNPGKIKAEMCPGGTLRPSIKRLVEKSGSYVIVSTKNNLIDEKRVAFEKTMAEALAIDPQATAQTVKFLDQEKLADWVNQYPGATLMVRDALGKSLCGWNPVTDLATWAQQTDPAFLHNEENRFSDESGPASGPITVAEGIDRLREALSTAGKCCRLVGLSGVGKTRLVRALFEAVEGCGRTLDPAITVYARTDGSTEPSVTTMAETLYAKRQRAILIIDDCGPNTHGDLVTICSRAGSQTSLLTIEHDVRDDQPETTAVFRLGNSSADLLVSWLEQTFPKLSASDQWHLAKFCDGNFRVARLIAATVETSGSLADLTDNKLFERIFWQRHSHDPQLQRDAEILSLLYSFAMDDEISDGEFATLAKLAGRTVDQLFTSAKTLEERGLIQSRGIMRAVLPHPVSNRLAADALRRSLRPAKLDAFATCLAKRPGKTRMLRSLAHRLGLLHSSPQAQKLVERWIALMGPLGDLLKRADGIHLITLMAPANQAATLTRLEQEITGPHGSQHLDPTNAWRMQWISLLHKLAYEEDLFARAATLLATFLAVEETENRHNSAEKHFRELFRVVYSGTKATPEQRQKFAESLIKGVSAGEQRAGLTALNELLNIKSRGIYSSTDFGAHPRDIGWVPTSKSQHNKWFEDSLKMALQLSEQFDIVKEFLANNLGTLWMDPACRLGVQAAVTHFAAQGGLPAAWVSLNTTLGRLIQRDANGDVSALKDLITQIEPADLIAKFQAYVIVAGRQGIVNKYGEDFVGASRHTRETQFALGQSFAADPTKLTAILPDAICAEISEEFGRGLAQGSANAMDIWRKLDAAYLAAPCDTRKIFLMCGFIRGLHDRDGAASEDIIFSLQYRQEYNLALPFLQLRSEIGETGLSRIRRSIEMDTLKENDYYHLSMESLRHDNHEILLIFLKALIEKEGNPNTIFSILHDEIYQLDDKNLERDSLIFFGRTALKQYNFSSNDSMTDYHAAYIVEHCLSGTAAVPDAEIVCVNLRAALESDHFDGLKNAQFLQAIFKAQPKVALDKLLGPGLPTYVGEGHIGNAHQKAVFLYVEMPFLIAWADEDPAKRYPLLGQVLPKGITNLSEEWQTYTAILEKSPDRVAFLESGLWADRPFEGWSGDLANILEKRKALVDQFTNHRDASVREWAVVTQIQLDQLIGEERAWYQNHERERENRFE